MNDQIYSVAQVNLYIKNMFARERILSRIYIKGEVSNCKYHTSGHIYFTLKDQNGQLTCVMFAGQRGGLSHHLLDGQSVIVFGSISVYERDGKYQLYAQEIVLDGAGALYGRFLAMKDRLNKEGLFDLKYKRPIKPYNQIIGIVTAETGAAIRDIMNIAARRNPYAQLYLYPAAVQGEGAKESIVSGIEYLDKLSLDVIIVGRGGGSIEDLWAFNEEAVAWAIFNCSTLVISAVGHETDTTIADYVADLRAPTPSAAAELAVTDIRMVENRLLAAHSYIRQCLEQKIKAAKEALFYRRTLLSHKDPIDQIRQKRQFLLDTEEKLTKRMEALIRERRYALTINMERIRGLSPLDRLNKGFSYVMTNDKRAVRSVDDVKPNDTVFIELKDGEAKAVIEATKNIRRT